jgi:hypothetical protein
VLELMHKRMLIALALAVTALAAFAWWQWRSDVSSLAEADVPLFEGFDKEHVTAIRVENVERSTNLKLERRSDGHWWLVDPFEAPADDSIASYLLGIALDRRGTPVPAADADARKLGLEPPRVVLELEARGANGPSGTRRQSIEIGAVDLDGKRIDVRARGRMLRTLRDLDTLLAKPVDDFRSRRVMTLDPRDVIEVHRRGSLVQEGATAPTDLALDAVSDGGEWRVTAPVAAALDPLSMSVWIQGATGLELEKYADQGTRLLADFGLDPPEISIELTTHTDEHKTLRLGRPGHSPGLRWCGTVDGQRYVWIVDMRPVYLLGSPLESLIDRRLTRFPRASIDGLRLRAGPREVELKRDGRDWSVASRVAGSTEFDPPEPADRRKVDEILARIERAEFGGFLLGEQLADAEVQGALHVLVGRDEQGGRIGAAHDATEGAHALRFQRTGDSVVALVDPGLLDVARTPIESLWTLELATFNELDLQSLVLSGASGERTFVRGSKGLWTPKGIDFEARELREVLDPLFFLRASERLPRGTYPPLRDPVTVELTNSMQTKTRFTIGDADDALGKPRAEIELEGRRSVLKDQALHKRLLAILAAK